MKINIESLEYPENLRKIKKPPKQLYLKGNIELLKTAGIAIIGSRKCTEYGEKNAKKFSKELSLQGLTIISGMAEGVDSFAHIGSIEVKGDTIAVLPCGFNNIYPKENIKLYEKILKNKGLILTEYEEHEKATSENFLQRNRIISGLSIGILVIEGGYRSGTSVTANIAKKQGKNVFCIPSSLENKKGITPNKLIKEGAFLVTDVKDIINKYPELNLKKREYIEEIIKIKKEKIIKEEYKDVYKALDEKNITHINEIVKKLKLDINEISYKLTMLELEDKIVSLPGNNFKKK